LGIMLIANLKEEFHPASSRRASPWTSKRHKSPRNL
jgi:hypothetical protein